MSSVACTFKLLRPGLGTRGPRRSENPRLRISQCQQGQRSSRIFSASVPLDAGSGGKGAGSDGPPGGGGGEGGRGGEGGGGDGALEGPVLWKGWNDRVSMDPQFPMKVLVEQVIGVGAAVLGDMSGRPNWGLKELDFVFSTLIVGSILNFSLMYLLAATPASAGGAGGSFIQKMFSENTLKALGAPGGHFFEAGYTLPQRMINLGYKGFLFSFVGLGAGLIGTGLSNGLLMMRRKFDPNFVLQNEVPNVLYNSLTWGCHMGVSSNLRYQALYGVDLVLTPIMHPKVFLVYSAVVRTINNMAGGVSFVFLAKLFGVQKASSSEGASEGAPE